MLRRGLMWRQASSVRFLCVVGAMMLARSWHPSLRSRVNNLSYSSLENLRVTGRYQKASPLSRMLDGSSCLS